jgi:hypothetical protein
MYTIKEEICEDGVTLTWRHYISTPSYADACKAAKALSLDSGGTLTRFRVESCEGKVLRVYFDGAIETQSMEAFEQ